MALVGRMTHAQGSSAAVICFDLDGTLTDPKDGILRSIRYALEQLAWPDTPSEQTLRECIGPPLLDSFTDLLKDPDLAARAVELYRERFAEKGLFENVLYPGITDVLEALKARGHTLYVATSKPSVFATKIITHFELTPFFDQVYGAELDGTRSDKTELLKWLIGCEGCEPETTTMIGDRKHDIIGARNNGLTTVGVLYGYGSEAELRKAGADKIVQQPGDLLTL